MLELPGWDRTRLAAAASSDVEAARWAAFARRLEPIVNDPIDSRLEVAQIEAIETPKARARAAKGYESRRREALTQGLIAQAEVRKVLLLDDEAEA